MTIAVLINNYLGNQEVPLQPMAYTLYSPTCIHCVVDHLFPLTTGQLPTQTITCIMHLCH
jgi:hypothetical protein